MRPLWLELLILLLQLGGALLVARFAVRWALSRFKVEKSWERQAAAMVDVVVAMGAMKRVASEWLADHYNEVSYTEGYRVQLIKLNRDAELKVREVSAAARLIMPSAIACHIEEIERKLTAADESSNFEERLTEKLTALEGGAEELISMGRMYFDAEGSDSPDPIRRPWAYIQHRNELRKSYGDQPK